MIDILDCCFRDGAGFEGCSVLQLPPSNASNGTARSSPLSRSTSRSRSQKWLLPPLTDPWIREKGETRDELSLDQGSLNCLVPEPTSGSCRSGLVIANGSAWGLISKATPRQLENRKGTSSIFCCWACALEKPKLIRKRVKQRRMRKVT